MLTAAVWQRALGRSGREQWLTGALTTLGLAVVVLTHPVAGAATAAALLAISLTIPDRRRALTWLVLVAVAATLLCLAWPYYSIIRLVDSQGVYDPSNAPMYEAWVVRIFPVLAALALFVYSTGTLGRARLGVYCVPLLALFVYGDVSGHYIDGRVISYIVIGAQIGLADLAGALEGPVLTRLRGRRLALVAGAVAILAVAELYNMRGGFRGSLPGTGAGPTVYASYRAAVDGLPANATIAAPLDEGAEAVIPVYAGRLIATHRPLAFVNDQFHRRQTVYTFFSPAATNEYRRQISVRYRVRYILAPATPDQSTLLRQLEAFGPIVRHGSTLDTIAVGG
jgi:hypothetical protein